MALLGVAEYAFTGKAATTMPGDAGAMVAGSFAAHLGEAMYSPGLPPDDGTSVPGHCPEWPAWTEGQLWPRGQGA
jgi:hypothetical protein